MNWREMTKEQQISMGPNSLLLAQVRESFGRIVYSHKTHEKQAGICFNKHRLQQGVLIILTAVSSGTFVGTVAGLLGTR